MTDLSVRPLSLHPWDKSHHRFPEASSLQGNVSVCDMIRSVNDCVNEQITESNECSQ